MYKVIIADDETSVRERLLNLLKKKNDEFEVIGSYENGYDALTSGVTLEPDLIITDIKMPYISGIELIREAKQTLPLVQSIIISGYDSFDYAKQAIDLGVISYVSKPITYNDLDEALKKAKDELDKKLNIDKNINNLQRQVESSLKILQGNDLMRLITMKDVPIAFKDKLISEGLRVDNPYQLITIFDFDQEIDSISNDEFELTRIYLMKYFDDEFEGFVDYYSFEDSEQTVVLLTSNKKLNKDELIEKMNEVIAKIKKTCNVSISCGISEISSDEISYRKLYRHAKRCLEYRTVVGSNIVLFFDDLETHNSNIKAIGKIDDNEYKAISYDILYGKENDAKTRINNLVNTISSTKYSESYYFILNNLLDTILKSCINLSKLYADYMPHLDIVQKVYSLKTSEQVYEYFDILLNEVTKINEASRLSGVESSFAQIKQYIESNYAKSTLSLEDLANELGYSVSYISAILKKNNTSFTKYLTDVRMDKAKVLLADNNSKLIAIAASVGYEDPYYFSHCFKKYFGVSPIEYRKK
jgi:Response regulator containing CheY-like receiver domain and AraC-type DNA-binding domain